MAPTIEELQAELGKRDEQIRGMSTKLRAHEKVVKDLGDAVQYDQWGNPMGVRTEPEPAARPTMTASNGHPLSGFSQLMEGWDPKSVDAYYQQLFQSQGYITAEQFQQYQTAIDQRMTDSIRGNMHLFENIRETLSHKDYADLANWDSPLSKRTLEVMGKLNYGKPLEGAKNWRQLNYTDPEALAKSARVARAELFMEQQANQASVDAAKTAQSASNLSATPANTGVASAGGTKPVAEMSEEEIFNAMDQTAEARPAP